ncbi:ScbA/BarX family gamma-butyrolactone biosynthesis protein [Microbispora sp. NPDC049125]|uniref:ScbA/BarX family gamma-butyrolactone biosynthesis protein n=1 Tax=Microbispora sp. NPDC049125 TaxID=3154929 RepID=UPI0034679852
MFQQTVPRRLVHREAVSEVFLTDIVKLTSDSFLVGAQWPRSHSFFGLRSGRSHDPMLVAETIRQAGLLVAHEGFSIGEDVKFLSHAKSFQVTQAGLELRDTVASIALMVKCHDIKRRRDQVGGMSLQFSAYRDGERIATADARMSCVPPRLYMRLRGVRAFVDGPPAVIPEPVRPCLVGRDAEADVVLAETLMPDTWLLRLDRRHPVMFEHSVDHVPGMAVIEAGRQAAHLMLGRTGMILLSCDFSFAQYVDLDEPCLVTGTVLADDGDSASVRVVFVQGGAEVAVGVLNVHEDLSA